MHTLATRTLAAVCTVAAAAVGGCGSPSGNDADPAPDGKPVAVVATTPVVADFTRIIGGDHVNVTQIVKAGVDPHHYEPTPADIQAVSTAAAVIKNGVGLEKWLDPIIASGDFAGPVIDTSQGVARRPGYPADPETTAGDPHIWHDPRNAKIMAINIQAGLVKVDPDDSGYYQQNLTAYVRKLDQLDAANEEKLSGIPTDRRKLVTDHDAFGYYAGRYRLEYVGSVVPGMDSAAEVSATQLNELVNKIKATGTTAVFTESSLPPNTGRAIAQEANVKVVDGPDALYGDSLGRAGTPEGTYLGAEQHNTDTIVAVLSG